MDPAWRERSPSFITPMHPQLDKIDRFIRTLDEASLEALQQISLEKSYKKGEMLLRPNELCRSSFQLTSGIARKYYLADAREITTELYFTDDLALSFES
jgi:hypothetical protein